MPIIIDKSELVRSTSLANVGIDGNVWIDTTTRRIHLSPHGQLVAAGDGGVTLRALYNYLKDAWFNDTLLTPFPFPLEYVAPKTSFEFINDWEMIDIAAIKLLRSAGFSVIGSSGAIHEQWACINNIDPDNTGAMYYVQDDNVIRPFVYSNPVNECIQIYSSSARSNFSRKSKLSVSSRLSGKKFDTITLSDFGVVELSYFEYKVSVGSDPDGYITHTDTAIDSNSDDVPDVAPYDNMAIHELGGSGFNDYLTGTLYPAKSVVRDTTTGRWFHTVLGGMSNGVDVGSDAGILDWLPWSGERQIDGSWYAFNRIVKPNVNGLHTPQLSEVYEFVQFQLRRDININSAPTDQTAGTVLGRLNGAEMMDFVGSSIVGRAGVFIDDLAYNTLVTMTLYDVHGVDRSYPFQAAGVLEFSANLVTDTDAVYAMYHANDYDTASALLVQDINGNDIAGQVTSGSVSFTFDYDNDTHGSGAGTDKDVIIVASGLSGSEHIRVDAQLRRSIDNNFLVTTEADKAYT